MYAIVQKERLAGKKKITQKNKSVQGCIEAFNNGLVEISAKEKHTMENSPETHLTYCEL